MKKLGNYARFLAIFWIFALILINFGAPWLLSESLLGGEFEAPDTRTVSPLSQIAGEARPRGVRSAENERRLKRGVGKHGWSAQAAGQDDADRELTAAGWGAD